MNPGTLALLEYPSVQPTPETLNKRYRQKFNPDDKDLFLRIFNQHRHVIERKEGDVLTLKLKHEAWRNVLRTYNEEASSERDLHQLRLLWKRMKKRSLVPPPKQDQLIPEEFTVMVNPFDINALNGNQTEAIKSGIPTPSPDSGDCLDFGREEEEDDKNFKPLQIVLDASGPDVGGLGEPLHMPGPRGRGMGDTECDAPEMGMRPAHKVSAYEQRLLAIAEKEHAQKMALLKRRKQNEALREELLRLKIKTQLLKQHRTKSEASDPQAQID